MFSAVPKVFSIPYVPRLSPKISSLGRWPAGIAAQRSCTAVIRADAASTTWDRPNRKESALGRYEYCIDTSAVFPPYMYSSELVTSLSTQPVPVGVKTATTARSNAPVRSISRTSSAARCRTSPFDSRPAYSRIGAVAGLPVNAVICAWLGALVTKLRPCRPSDSQLTSEPDPPERSADVGCTTPRPVPLSVIAADRSKVVYRLSTRMPSKAP
jgi:hypothetical protein